MVLDRPDDRQCAGRGVRALRLKFETLYEIGALCPYCMVVWAVTIPLFVVSASIALKPLVGNPVARFLYNWRWPIVVL